jgi:hypothetical protein
MLAYKIYPFRLEGQDGAVTRGLYHREEALRLFLGEEVDDALGASRFRRSGVGLGIASDRRVLLTPDVKDTNVAEHHLDSGSY